MTTQRKLQPATKRLAVDGCDHRFCRAFDAVDQPRKLRFLRRLAELLDIRAGKEGAPRADDHESVQLGAGVNALHRPHQPRSHGVRECIHRGMVDLRDRDSAKGAKAHGIWHRALRLQRAVGAAA